jgi:hypothetical protein
MLGWHISEGKKQVKQCFFWVKQRMPLVLKTKNICCEVSIVSLDPKEIAGYGKLVAQLNGKPVEALYDYKTSYQQEGTDVTNQSPEFIWGVKQTLYQNL